MSNENTHDQEASICAEESEPIVIGPTSTTTADKKADVIMELNEFPDPVLLENLVSMGMDKKLSKKALVCSKNKSIEAALDWIAELGAEEMEALCGHSDHESGDDSDWEDCEGEDDEVFYKMVFVVNTELGMGMGKVASQVGHASIGLYRVLLEGKDKFDSSREEWEEFGEKKITVRGKNAQEIIQLRLKAESNDLPTYIVQDQGKTQIPSGSLTVLGIFGDEAAVDEVTGHLRLL